MPRYASSCSAIAVGTSSGHVALAVLADEVVPQWVESAPQCIFDGDTLLATRMQVGADASAPPAFLLLDIIDLQVDPHSVACYTLLLAVRFRKLVHVGAWQAAGVVRVQSKCFSDAFMG